LAATGAGFTPDEIDALFDSMDLDHSGAIDYIDWLDFVEPLWVCALYKPAVHG
jgi:Ca2+-binding EF-hand superfamily protein